MKDQSYIWVSLTMVLCIIVGCGNKSGKSSQKKDSAVKFSRLPKIARQPGNVFKKLDTRQSEILTNFLEIARLTPLRT